MLTQTENKITYAKWKAAQISKALREGIAPTPGPATKSHEDTDKEDLLVHKQADDLGEASMCQSRNPAFASSETLKEPQKEDITLPSVPESTSSKFSSLSLDTKDAPSLPDVPLDNEHPHMHVIPSEHGPVSNLQTDPPTLPSAPATQPKPSPVDDAFAPSHAENMSSSANTALESHITFPSQHQPSAPQTAKDAAYNAARTVQTDLPKPGLRVVDIIRVQKLARWASSALDYEDVQTARNQLHEALAILDRAP